ncbi:MAG: type II toxin-antitoxin system Phd/YefM family antitoxin [Longimicrobiales bacterium]
MRTTSIAELKARLSHYLRLVRRGEEIVVTDRGRPVARLGPIAAGTGLDERVRRLVAEGLARPPSGELPRDFWKRPRPLDPQGRSLTALLEERADER